MAPVRERRQNTVQARGVRTVGLQQSDEVGRRLTWTCGRGGGSCGSIGHTVIIPRARPSPGALAPPDPVGGSEKEITFAGMSAPLGGPLTEG